LTEEKQKEIIEKLLKKCRILGTGRWQREHFEWLVRILFTENKYLALAVKREVVDWIREIQRDTLIDDIKDGYLGCLSSILDYSDEIKEKQLEILLETYYGKIMEYESCLISNEEMLKLEREIDPLFKELILDKVEVENKK